MKKRTQSMPPIPEQEMAVLDRDGRESWPTCPQHNCPTNKRISPSTWPAKENGTHP